MLKKTLAKAKNIFSGIKVIDSPAYRIADIIQDDKGEYKAIIQIVGKKDFFKIKPEEILSDDNLTALFHQHDVRLLTYLGYCGVNMPQYKILAKKMLANEGLELAIYNNKTEKFSIKNLQEIPTNDQEIIGNLNSQDAYDLGFAHGRKSIFQEQELLKKLKQYE